MNSDQIKHLIILAEFFRKDQKIIDYLYQIYCEQLWINN